MIASMDFSVLSDNPPFERPVITEVNYFIACSRYLMSIKIMQNFINYKFGSLQEMHRNNMGRIGAFFINIINRPGMIGAFIHNLPAPLGDRYSTKLFVCY